MATQRGKLGQPRVPHPLGAPQTAYQVDAGSSGLTPAPFFFPFWELTCGEALAGTLGHLIWK